MSKFDVFTNNLRNSAEGFMQGANALRSCSREVEEIRRRIDFSDELNRSVGYSLQMIVYTLNEESRSCSNLASGLSQAIQRYEDAEQSICGRAQITWGNAVRGGARKENQSFNITIKIIKELLIKAAGPLGTLYDAVKNGAEGKTKNVVTDIIDLVGGYVENSEGTKINWKDWFNFKYSKTNVDEIASSAIGKYTDVSIVRKGISTACNWAYSIVSSAFDNYDEFGSFCSRFWEETAVESLLNIGEGILIGAGVGIAFAGAPAIAVGAAAAGITVLVDWGLDSLFSLASNGTQTKWTEAVSDVVCDIGEKAAGWLKSKAADGVSAIKNSIQNLAGSICPWGSFSFG